MKTYLYTIARSRALNYLKREKKIISLEENIDYYANKENINQIEDTVFSNDKKRNIHNAIKKLNESQQRAVFLADIEELSYREICKITGKTLSQIKMTIYRARKNLKKILMEEGLNNE